MFINIFVPLNILDQEEYQQGTTKKTINLLKQFLVLYKSIKSNFININYDIYLLYNNEFKENDYNLLKNLDLNLIKIDIDKNLKKDYTIVEICMKRLNISTKIKGTHRLLLECDQIFLKEPLFDYNVDFQAMYAGNIRFEKKYFDYIINKFSFKKFDEEYYLKKELFKSYIESKNYDNLLPHFNNGCIFIKEEFAMKIYDFIKQNIYICLEDKYLTQTQDKYHTIAQIFYSFSYYNLSNSWKPFNPGINYLIKCYDIQKFGINNITHVHYCGIGGYEIAYKNFIFLFDNI